MKRSLVSLSDVKRFLVIALVGFVLWLGVYNWIVLGIAGDLAKALIFALVILARDIIRAAQMLRTSLQTTHGLRTRMRGWRQSSAT